MSPRLQHYTRLLIAALVLFFAGVVTGAWLANKPTPPAGEWTAPKKDGRIADVGTEPIKPKDCTVIAAKPAAKEKLGLPDQVKQDPKKHIISAVIIQPDERPQSCVGIFDEFTGKTDTLTQRMAYPLLATEQRGRFGLAAGYKTGQRVGHIYLGETLVQVKGWHVGGALHLFTDRDHVEEVVVEYRW
jgi:hypothetical protein